MTDDSIKFAHIIRLIAGAAVLASSVIGLVVDMGGTEAKILAGIVVGATAVTLDHWPRSPTIAIAILAIASALAGVIVTRSAAHELSAFGIEHFAPSIAVAIVVTAIAPLSGAMMLVAVPDRVTRSSLGRSVLAAAGLCSAALVLAVLGGALAATAFGALQTDYGLVRHELANLELVRLLLRGAAAMAAAGAVAFIGVRLSPRRMGAPMYWAALCATVAALSIVAIGGWSPPTS